QAITVAFDEYRGTPDDEAPLAEKTAKLLGIRHSTVRISRELFFELYDDFFASMDQPSIDGLNTYLVSHAAAAMGLKVVLSGLGGDELFGGYPSFKQIPRFLRIGSAIKIAGRRVSAIEKSVRAVLPRSISPKLAGLLSHSRDLPSAFLLRRCLHMSHELELL